MHFVEIYYIPTRGRCGIHQWNNANLWLTVSHVEPRNARIPGLGATRNHPIFWGLRKLISFEIFRILKNTSVKFLPLWTLDFDLVYWCFLNCVCVFLKENPQCSIISPLLCCQPWHLRNYDVPGIWCVDVLLWLWQCLEEVEVQYSVDARSWSKGNIVISKHADFWL